MVNSSLRLIPYVEGEVRTQLMGSSESKGENERRREKMRPTVVCIAVYVKSLDYALERREQGSNINNIK